MTSISIIVPVLNALDHVRRCLDSLVAVADRDTYIVIVDDGSYDRTRVWLESFAGQYESVTLIRHATRQGYLAAVESGLALSNGDIVVFQNSDTIVFEGFCEALRTSFAAGASIGVVTPVSVWANWTRIPFPAGESIFGLAALLRSTVGDELADIYNASGFSFAIRRDVLAEVGGFDDRYHPGYWEETDLCMRVLQAGYRVVVNKGLFVFHHGWASFGSGVRHTLMARNERIFRGLWGSTYADLERERVLRDPLRQLRVSLERRHPRDALGRSEAGGRKPLSVLYVLPNLALYGGVVSVVQLVNELVCLGVDARIAVVGGRDDGALRYGPCYVSPIWAVDDHELMDKISPVDIAVATHWRTAYSVSKLSARGLARRLVYFVQDDEADFYPEGSKERTLARHSYWLIPDRICKSPWLRQRLERFHGRTRIVEIGLNLDVFHDYGQPRVPSVVAMARPSSPRRNWEGTRRILGLIAEHRPDVHVGIFGCNRESETLPAGIHNYGELRSGPEVAALLNRFTVLIDASLYQGLGRPGLEAMACGVVPVLTKNGGITSYAKHGVNCLLVDPTNAADVLSAVIALLDDKRVYESMRLQGLETAARYSLRSEAERTLAVLERVDAKCAELE